MALYYPLASAANKPNKRRQFFSLYGALLFRVARFLGAFALGLFVLLSPDLGARHGDVGWLLMLVLAPLSVLVDFCTPDRHRLVAQTAYDLAGIALCCSLLPSVWFAGLLLGALILGGGVPRFALTHKLMFVLVPTAFIGSMAMLAQRFLVADASLPLLTLTVGTPFCLLWALRERQREQALKEQSNLMNALTHMAGAIGHDFNNLLTGIQGNAELAEQKLGPNHVARPFVQELLTESQKAQLFSAQLLAFSGGVATGRERLDVHAELMGIAGLLESALPSGVRLQIEAEEHLPLVSANRAQLQEIVVAGMLHIADTIKLAPAEVIVSLRRVSLRYRDELVLQLRPNALHEKHSSSAGAQEIYRQNLASLRFGLASAQAIMREHDGQIDVHGNAREGRVITLRLPGLSDSRSEKQRVKAPSPTVPRHLLLLESKPEVREVVRNLLLHLGHSVTLVENDSKVLGVLASDPSIDVVILDTPSLQAQKLLTRIDEIRPELPALLPESARKNMGEWAGRPNVNYVAKPHSSASLNSAIRQLFDRLSS